MVLEIRITDMYMTVSLPFKTSESLGIILILLFKFISRRNLWRYNWTIVIYLQESTTTFHNIQLIISLMCQFFLLLHIFLHRCTYFHQIHRSRRCRKTSRRKWFISRCCQWRRMAGRFINYSLRWTTQQIRPCSLHEVRVHDSDISY
jgi:hypothetical protein